MQGKAGQGRGRAINGALALTLTLMPSCPHALMPSCSPKHPEGIQSR